MSRSLPLKWTLPLFAAAGLVVSPTPFAGSASQAATRDRADPLEPMNRGLYAVHRVLDRAVVRPLMVVYTTVAPRPVRAGARNVVENLGEPITFVNDVLQVRPRRASRTVARFATNSTVGVLGLFNVAKHAGYPRHYSDFGQTLGRYGVGPGPYLFIPILGPSSLRDMTGRVGDSVADPVNMVRFDGRSAVRIARPTITGLDLRARFDKDITELEKTATDPYVTLRSAYLQNRRSYIHDGQVDVQSLPSFTPEPAAPAQAPAPGPGAALDAGPAGGPGLAQAGPALFRSY